MFTALIVISPCSRARISHILIQLEQMKDMLLTYNEYNRDLGYVQGMSDLLAPIYAVMQDDALAFWGFVKFMERMVDLP